MSYRGDFDPAGFDPSDPGTWPPMPSGGYTPGDWWYVVGPGTVNGQAVDVGDRVYPVGTGRLYGEDTWGADVYGGPVPDGPWFPDPDRVWWRAVVTAGNAWDRQPAPYAGCPLVDGWRLVVEALFVPDVDDTRDYGDDRYGQGTFGDDTDARRSWQDVTGPVAGVVIRQGAPDAGPYVPVDELELDVIDRTGTVWDVAPGDPFRQITVGTLIRTSVIDPEGLPRGLFVGRVEQITDDHDQDVKRVAVIAYGLTSDLATTGTVDRSAEAADVRIRALADLAGWTWGVTDTWPTPTPTLRRTDPLTDAPLRQEVDRAALSAGWTVDTDPSTGVLRAREWPLVPSGDPIVVTDDVGATGLPGNRIGYRTDAWEVLNVVTVETVAVQGAPAEAVTVEDPPSVARLGRRSTAFGFPLVNLSTDPTDLAGLAARILARFSRTTARVEGVDVTTSLDRRWVAVLAGLDTGRAARVVRTKPSTITTPAVVVGYEHRILPGRFPGRGRWDATLYLTPTDPAF